MKYLKSVFKEAKRVEWPKGKKLKEMSLSVIVVCGIFAGIFWVMDLIINSIFNVMGI